MAKTDVVRARIDVHVKEEATIVLEKMGLTPSDAIRMFLTSVANKKELPFHPMDFFEPNTETIAAIEELERGENVTTCETVEELMERLNAPD
jgi:DNA-damage-inducible protein J